MSNRPFHSLVNMEDESKYTHRNMNDVMKTCCDEIQRNVVGWHWPAIKHPLVTCSLPLSAPPPRWGKKELDEQKWGLVAWDKGGLQSDRAENKQIQSHAKAITCQLQETDWSPVGKKQVLWTAYLPTPTRLCWACCCITLVSSGQLSQLHPLPASWPPHTCSLGGQREEQRDQQGKSRWPASTVQQ